MINESIREVSYELRLSNCQLIILSQDIFNSPSPMSLTAPWPGTAVLPPGVLPPALWAVVVENGDSVVHDAVGGHHVGVESGHVGHGGREVEIGRVGGAHADLQRARPLRHRALQLHREDFAGTERSVGEDHAVIEIVLRAAEKGRQETCEMSRYIGKKIEIKMSSRHPILMTKITNKSLEHHLSSRPSIIIIVMFHA